MTDAAQPRTRNNWFLFLPLVLLSTIFVIAGATLTYYLVTEQFGYSGGKSGVIYLGGAVGGYMITQPLWTLYRKRYPKAPKAPKN